MSTVVCWEFRPPRLRGEILSTHYIDHSGEEILVSVSPIKNTTELSRFGFGGEGGSEDHMRGNTDGKWVVLLKLPKEHIKKKNRLSDQAISFDRVFIYFCDLHGCSILGE